MINPEKNFGGLLKKCSHGVVTVVFVKARLPGLEPRTYGLEVPFDHISTVLPHLP